LVLTWVYVLPVGTHIVSMNTGLSDGYRKIYLHLHAEKQISNSWHVMMEYVLYKCKKKQCL